MMIPLSKIGHKLSITNFETSNVSTSPVEFSSLLYHRTLLPAELIRHEAVKQRLCVLKPNPTHAAHFQQVFGIAPPELSFTAQAAGSYLKTHLRSPLVPTDREYLFFVGGAASHIVDERIPHYDVDLSCYLSQGNYQPIKNQLIDFIIFQLQQLSSSYKIDSEEKRRLILNSYLYKKVFLKEKIKDVEHIHGSYICLGQIDVKFFADNRMRRSLSSTDGFHVGFDGKMLYCVKGNRTCNQAEFEQAVANLGRFRCPIAQAQEVRELAFPLLHRHVRGFTISPESDVKEALPISQESDAKETEALSVEEIALEQLKKEYPPNSGKLSKRLLHYMQGHYSPMGKGFFFLNFLSWVQQEKNVKIRHAYSTYSATVWLNLCHASQSSLLKHFAQLVQQHPKEVPQFLALIQGILLSKWLQDYQHLSASQDTLQAWHRAVHSSFDHIPLMHREGTCYLMNAVSPVLIALNFVQAYQHLDKKGLAIGCITSLAKDFDSQDHSASAIIDRMVTGFQTSRMVSGLVEQFQAPLQPGHFFAFLLEQKSSVLSQITEWQLLCAALEQMRSTLASQDSLIKVVHVFQSIINPAALISIKQLRADLVSLPEATGKELKSIPRLNNAIQQAIIAILNRIVDTRDLALLEETVNLVGEIRRTSLSTLEELNQPISQLLGWHLQLATSNEPNHLLLAARLFHVIEKWSAPTADITKLMKKIHLHLTKELRPAVKQLLNCRLHEKKQIKLVYECLLEAFFSFSLIGNQQNLVLFKEFLIQALWSQEILFAWCAGVLAEKLIAQNQIKKGVQSALRQLSQKLIDFAQNSPSASSQNYLNLGLRLQTFLPKKWDASQLASIKTILTKMATTLCLSDGAIRVQQFESFSKAISQDQQLSPLFSVPILDEMAQCIKDNPSQAIYQFLQIVSHIDLSLAHHLLFVMHEQMTKGDLERSALQLIAKELKEQNEAQFQQAFKLWEWLQQTIDNPTCNQIQIAIASILLVEVSRFPNAESADRLQQIVARLLVYISHIANATVEQKVGIALLQGLKALISQIKPQTDYFLPLADSLWVALYNHRIFSDAELHALFWHLFDQCIKTNMHIIPIIHRHLSIKSSLVMPRYNRLEAFCQTIEHLLRDETEKQILLACQITEDFLNSIRSANQVETAQLTETILSLMNQLLAKKNEAAFEQLLQNLREHFLMPLLAPQLSTQLLELGQWDLFVAFCSMPSVSGTLPPEVEKELFRLVLLSPNAPLFLVHFIHKEFLLNRAFETDKWMCWTGYLRQSSDPIWLSSLQHSMIDGQILQDSLQQDERVICCFDLFAYLHNLSRNTLNPSEDSHTYASILVEQWDKLPTYVSSTDDLNALKVKLAPLLISIIVNTKAFLHFSKACTIFISICPKNMAIGIQLLHCLGNHSSKDAAPSAQQSATSTMPLLKLLLNWLTNSMPTAINRRQCNELFHAIRKLFLHTTYTETVQQSLSRIIANATGPNQNLVAKFQALIKPTEAKSEEIKEKPKLPYLRDVIEEIITLLKPEKINSNQIQSNLVNLFNIFSSCRYHPESMEGARGTFLRRSVSFLCGDILIATTSNKLELPSSFLFELYGFWHEISLQLDQTISSTSHLRPTHFKTKTHLSFNESSCLDSQKGWAQKLLIYNNDFINVLTPLCPPIQTVEQFCRQLIHTQSWLSKELISFQDLNKLLEMSINIFRLVIIKVFLSGDINLFSSIENFFRTLVMKKGTSKAIFNLYINIITRMETIISIAHGLFKHIIDSSFPYNSFKKYCIRQELEKFCLEGITEAEYNEACIPERLQLFTQIEQKMLKIRNSISQ